MIYSLAQTVLKLTSPGVPDIYQGNELWDFSLVDPDNRRPVDYEARKALIENLDRRTPGDLWKNWTDGAIKMKIIQSILTFRRELPQLFTLGSYEPLEARGEPPLGRRLSAQTRIQRTARRCAAPPRNRWRRLGRYPPAAPSLALEEHPDRRVGGSRRRGDRAVAKSSPHGRSRSPHNAPDFMSDILCRNMQPPAGSGSFPRRRPLHRVGAGEAKGQRAYPPGRIE